MAVAAIDNLGKGATGHALQNANLMTGRKETAGLSRLPLWPLCIDIDTQTTRITSPVLVLRK